MLDITLNGTFRCTRAALRQMVAQGGGGVVVNNASVLGWRAQEGQAHYAAAKAGRDGADPVRGDGRRQHGIRVNAVAPSLATHPFLAKVMSDGAAGRAGGPRGVRPRRRAVGGRHRHRVPGQRLLVVPDRRSHLGQQPASLSAATHPSTAAPNCSTRPAVRRARLRPRRCATSPTPRGSCPAACTTTSTRRRRWWTRSCGVPGRAVQRYRAIVGVVSAPRKTLEAVVVASFTAIDEHNSAVAIYQAEARHLADQPRFDYIRERLVEFLQALERDVLSAGASPTARCGPISTSSSPTGFLRDTVWVGVSWYRPGGALEASKRSPSSTCPSCSTASRYAGGRRGAGV